MNFLKNNLVAIVVSLLTFGALATANTITRPYGPPDYAGGQKAVGAKVNAEFENITTWLNTGNISSLNIASGGVETINIADGAVTPEKLSALNITITDASSYFTTTSTTQQDVTNLSGSITTNGRAVVVEMIPTDTQYPYDDGLGNVNTLSSWYEAPTTDDGHVLLIKDSSTLVDYRVNTGTGPCSAFSYVDDVSAGTYTYKVAIRTDAGLGAIVVSGCKLVIREL